MPKKSKIFKCLQYVNTLMSIPAFDIPHHPRFPRRVLVTNVHRHLNRYEFFYNENTYQKNFFTAQPKLGYLRII